MVQNERISPCFDRRARISEVSVDPASANIYNINPSARPNAPTATPLPVIPAAELPVCDWFGALEVEVRLVESKEERLMEPVVEGVEVTEMGGKEVESVPGREVWMVTTLSVDSVMGNSVSMDDEPTVGSTIRDDLYAR